ncbi:MAG: monovalent cation/H(+) antiporter subunit G [Gemmatimonadota bacterium]|nr:monovalent cation/H(+) antiporter subunit G [Gemmatimonadota bacterium]MDE2870988.1 monovalent cation/H(+) antiporter subunit G [Gemmatimonadota bacterium]
MMEQVLPVLTWVLLLSGAFFLVTGALGMVRLPDVFTRMHAAGMTDTMGAGLILVGLCLHSGVNLVTMRLLLVLAFLWFTAPIATHAVAKAALAAGTEPYTLGAGEGGADGGEGEGGGAP